jgi:hypothetical protein
MERNNLEADIQKEMNTLKSCWNPRIFPLRCLCHPDTEYIPSYLKESFYDHHLARWFAIFPRESFLILPATELKENTLQVMRQVETFLGLSPHDYGDILEQRLNMKEKGQVAEEFVTRKIEEQLTELFQNTIKNVKNMTGIDLSLVKL